MHHICTTHFNCKVSHQQDNDIKTPEDWHEKSLAMNRTKTPPYCKWEGGEEEVTEILTEQNLKMIKSQNMKQFPNEIGIFKIYNLNYIYLNPLRCQFKLQKGHVNFNISYI